MPPFRPSALCLMAKTEGLAGLSACSSKFFPILCHSCLRLRLGPGFDFGFDLDVRFPGPACTLLGSSYANNRIDVAAAAVAAAEVGGALALLHVRLGSLLSLPGLQSSEGSNSSSGYSNSSSSSDFQLRIIGAIASGPLPGTTGSSVSKTRGVCATGSSKTSRGYSSSSSDGGSSSTISKNSSCRVRDGGVVEATKGDGHPFWKGNPSLPPAVEAAAGSDVEVQEVPVVICGAGPTGLTLSLLLAKYDVRHVVLERALGPTQHPQAHFINNRTMEVFRSLGLSTSVRQHMPPLEQWRRFVYCEGVAGRLYGEVDHFPGQSSPFSPHLSPESVAHLPQHKLLKIMLQRQAEVAATAAATSPQQPLISVLHPPDFKQGASSKSSGSGAAVSWGSALRGISFRRLQAPPVGAAAAGAVRDRTEVEVEVEVEMGSDTVEATAGVEPPPPRQRQRPRRAVLRCQYLVAADGAHSIVRGLMGGKLEGQGALQHLLNVHFTSTALGRLAASRPAMLYFVFNPEVVAVLVAHDIEAGEFVAQIPYFPPLQSPADFPPHRIIQMIRAAAGQLAPGGASNSEVDVQLLQLRPWTMTAEVADRFAFAASNTNCGVSGGNSDIKGGVGIGSSNDRLVVFLAGDSAHRFPPAGGFGMNTGVQDAANLAWKLAAVLKGLAGEMLLASYESERRPIALANTALSVRNWDEATRVPAALGLDPRVAHAVNSLVTNAAPLPHWVRKGLLEAALDLGRRIAGPEGLPLPLLGTWRQQQVQRILRSGASLRLQFPAEDLGYVYDKGAVVVQQSSGSGFYPEVTAGAAATVTTAATRLPPRGALYKPSSAPGCRLPHCWLQLPRPSPTNPGRNISVSGSSDGGSTRDSGWLGAEILERRGPHIVLSTLDLVADPWVGPRLLLFTDDDPGQGGNPWLAAALQLYERVSGPDARVLTDSVSAPFVAASPTALPPPPPPVLPSLASTSSSPSGRAPGGGSLGQLVVVRVLPAAAAAAPAVTETNACGLDLQQRQPVELENLPYPTAVNVQEPPEGSVLAAFSWEVSANSLLSGRSTPVNNISVGSRRSSSSSSSSRSSSSSGEGSYGEAVKLTDEGDQAQIRGKVSLVELREATPSCWVRAMALPPGSCLLVRPDGHVAWRHLGAPRNRPSPAPRPPQQHPPTVAETDATSATTEGFKDTVTEAVVDVAVAELRSVLAALHWQMPG